jgi:transposase
MQSFHCGIDVAKAKLDCALRLVNGKYKNKALLKTQWVMRLSGHAR